MNVLQIRHVCNHQKRVLRVEQPQHRSQSRLPEASYHSLDGLRPRAITSNETREAVRISLGQNRDQFFDGVRSRCSRLEDAVLEIVIEDLQQRRRTSDVALAFA